MVDHIIMRGEDAMSQFLSQVYRDVYAHEISQGATPKEAHKAAQEAVREASD